MNLPGYQIQRPLIPSVEDGRFIATREESINQYVVHIWDFEDDAEAATRYLDRLKRLATLRCRQICEITDFGSVGNEVYVVFPYYLGGSLSDVQAQGLTLQTLLYLITDICEGLQALHRQGLVHGDVNPTNIVFDHAGTAILVSGNYLAPAQSEVKVDPRFAAPEMLQGEGQTLKSDIYAFGVVVLSILLGTLPWQSEESDQAPSRTTTDAIPPLGTQFESLEPVLDRMVAFEPSERYESIEQVRRAFEGIALSTSSRETAIKSDLISTAEINAALPPVQGTQLSNSESFRLFNRRSVVSLSVTSVVLLLGLWGIGYALFNAQFTQYWLSSMNLVENPALVDARRNVQALVADPKQNLLSIVAAYEAVLDIMPEDPDSLRGIEETKQSWFGKFDDALMTNDLNVAQLRLNELLALDPDDSDLLRQYERLQLRRQAVRLTTDTLALLSVDQNETDASRDMALHAFREVIRLYPASADANRELDTLANHFLDRATSDVETGNIQGAVDNLGKAGMANSQHPRLASVRDLVQRATTVREEINARLAEATRLQQQGKLIDPPANNAAELYHTVLATEPEHEEALQGLGAISTGVVELFEEHLQARDFSAVRDLIERAKKVGLYPASILHMESMLVEETERISKAADLVISAESLIAAGYLTEPENDNAVALLEEAKQLDPLNDRVSVLLDQCADRLAVVALDAHKAGLSSVATSYLNFAREVIDDAERWQDFRQSHGLDRLN